MPGDLRCCGCGAYPSTYRTVETCGACHASRLATLIRARDEALADLAESRRAFERAVDDQHIEDASTAETIATLTRERDEARAEAERLRDRLQTVVDEQVSPHETLTAEELITLLEHSLAKGRHERERLRGALERAERHLTELADVETFDAEVPWPENEKPEERARAGAEDAHAALAGEGEARIEKLEAVAKAAQAQQRAWATLNAEFPTPTVDLEIDEFLEVAQARMDALKKLVEPANELLDAALARLREGR